MCSSDLGVGRCDFPAGSADDLYTSVHDKLYGLPDATRTFTGHDYQPGGRPLQWQTTIEESRTSNIHIKAETPKDSYVSFRTGRDATLSPPALLFPALQVNIRAGALPEPDPDGTRRLRLPMGIY